MFTRSPQFDGAAHSQWQTLPVLSTYQPNGFFADTLNGAGFNASTDKAWEAGVRLLPDLGRDEPAALRGMGRIRPTLLASAFANANLSDRLQLQSTLNAGSGYDHRGIRLDVGASYAYFVAGPFQLGVDVSAGWANGHYAGSYYGVSPDQAARSARPAYASGAGIDQLRADLTFFAPLSEHWISYGSLGRNWLRGDAGHSPTTAQPASTVLVLGLSHLF
jgi:outer membrane scaffolding protein for murein synthesis (MipA/OmpV family)